LGTSSFPGVNYGRGMLLANYPLLVPRSWKSRAILLPTLWATTGPLTGKHFYSLLSSLTICLICLSYRHWSESSSSVRWNSSVYTHFFSRIFPRGLYPIGTPTNAKMRTFNDWYEHRSYGSVQYLSYLLTSCSLLLIRPFYILYKHRQIYTRVSSLLCVSIRLEYCTLSVLCFDSRLYSHQCGNKITTANILF